MRLLAFSDIDWSKYNYLKSLVLKEKPDLVMLAGDIGNDGLSHAKSRLQDFLLFLDRRLIKTFAIRGNWDQNDYDQLFQAQRFRFVEEISGRYAHFAGFTFLGIPYSFFRNMKNVRNIDSVFPRTPLDFILAHPPTKKRIWLFHLKPKYVVSGHDDNRVCSVTNTLLISTNSSPDSYAKLEISPTLASIVYHDSQSRRAFKAKWKNGTLNWITEEHSCDRSPHLYPARDSDYGRMLELLGDAKKSTVTRDLSTRLLKRLLKLGAPITLIKEYLGVSNGQLRLTEPILSRSDAFPKEAFGSAKEKGREKRREV